jgi:hypothetical protein
MAKVNPPGAPVGGLVAALIMNLILIWLYAAIRPRFGPGPRTAAIAALVVSGAASLIANLAGGYVARDSMGNEPRGRVAGGLRPRLRFCQTNPREA